MSKKYVKTPSILQMETTECGAASLAMVLAYFGCNIPLEKLRIDTGVSRNGVNAKNIMFAAQSYGLEVKGYSKKVDGLLQLPLPCIIHWNFNHFVVFEGVKGKHFVINDPAQGRRKLTREEFAGSFTGVCLTFQKGPDFKTVASEKNEAKLAVRRLSSEKKAIISMLLMGLLLVIPGIVTPVFSQIFIDDILIGQMHDWMLALLLAMLLTLAYSVFFKVIRVKLLMNLRTKMALISAYSFLNRMFQLPISFFDQRYAGDLSERVKNNNKVNEFLTGQLGQAVLDVFVAIFYIGIMFLYSSFLSIIGLGFVLITVAYTIIAAKATEIQSKKLQQEQGRMIGTLYSGLSIRDTLKASGAESAFVSRLLGLHANLSRVAQKLGRISQVIGVIPQAIMRVADVVILSFGGLSVIRGYMTPGSLVAFMQLLSSVSTPVIAICGLFMNIQSLKADLLRVEDIEKYPMPEKKEVVDSNISGKLEGNVELRDISFGYSVHEPPVVQNFSLNISAGSSVALVGASGCGKSTVAKVVSGLHDPWEGEVLFDGMPLDEIPHDVFCQSVATVSQDIMLFTGTVRDNLTLWTDNLMNQDILSAAKDACIHDYITTLPGAYDYEIDESGRNLSGGQRQRMEIARALVASPSIVVLDEATSALDPIVEKEVMDNIKRRGCSMIIIAHRLSTIRDCDEIIVMDKGIIVERGTHEELIAANGVYKGLIENA